jgi:hypothetical protein
LSKETINPWIEGHCDTQVRNDSGDELWMTVEML